MQKSIWFASFTLDDLNARSRGSLSDHLGVQYTEIGPDFLAATMPVETRTMQPMGIMHGGASAALAESVGSVAANGCVDQRTKVCVGIDLNINHIRSVKSGRVTAIAKPLHLGRTTQVWDIKIINEEKRLVSASRLTLAIVEKK